MLSYQHAYHAGCLADVHKHSTLCWILSQLVQKDKPLTYIETHAGRGLYHLDSAEAQKTQEAKAGIESLSLDKLEEAGHPYPSLLVNVRARFGKTAYPGSPLIADSILRQADKMHLAELHPQEVEALKQTMKGSQAEVVFESGYALAKRLIPPTPKRGVLMIDPSYEIKTEYDDVSNLVSEMHRKWPVGVIILWYPLLEDNRHLPMLNALKKIKSEKTFCHEVLYKKTPLLLRYVQKGSGLFLINAPYQIEKHLDLISSFFERENRWISVCAD